MARFFYKNSSLQLATELNMDKLKQESGPPIMGTWQRLYVLVLLIYLVVMLIFIYLTFFF